MERAIEYVVTCEHVARAFEAGMAAEEIAALFSLDLDDVIEFYNMLNEAYCNY
jgi:hypothetical protein